MTERSDEAVQVAFDKDFRNQLADFIRDYTIKKFPGGYEYPPAQVNECKMFACIEVALRTTPDHAAVVEALPETQEHYLRTMVSNYKRGDEWDSLDLETCEAAADEIKALRTALSTMSKAPQAGGHDCYEIGKPNAEAPEQIKDRNGVVVLQYCKRCGEYEAGLDNPCAPSSRAAPAPQVASGGAGLLINVVRKFIDDAHSDSSKSFPWLHNWICALENALPPKAAPEPQGDAVRAFVAQHPRMGLLWQTFGKSEGDARYLANNYLEEQHTGWQLIEVDVRPAALTAPPGKVTIQHDGFVGDIIGRYTTREGKRGVVVQQEGTKVVHVYGEKWLTNTPSPALDRDAVVKALVERVGELANMIGDLHFDGEPDHHSIEVAALAKEAAAIAAAISPTAPAPKAEGR